MIRFEHQFDFPPQEEFVRVPLDSLLDNPFFTARVEYIPEISGRAKASLARKDIVYVGELIQISAPKLSQMTRFGGEVAVELTYLLQYKCDGLRLGTVIDPPPPPQPLFREMLSGARPFGPTRAVMTVAASHDEVGNQTDLDLIQEITRLFRDAGTEFAFGKPFPEPVKKSMLAALRLARSSSACDQG